MSASPQNNGHSTCIACGCASGGAQLCDDCKPAARFLHPDLATRLEALAAARVGDRPAVLLAALRGGRLWTGRAPDGADLGRVILGWLVHNGMTMTFARWLAEDARYGDLVYGTLARQEPTRTLQRAPVWLFPGRESAKSRSLLYGWWGNPAKQCALGFRFGSLHLSEAHLEQMLVGTNPLFRFWVKLASRRAERHPTEGSWRPSPQVFEAATRWQRWPIENLRPRAIACCVNCGEALPANGPCRWCGAEPTRPGNTLLLPTSWLLAERKLCPTCGIDQTSKVVPRRCPGCLNAIAYSDLGLR